MIEIAGQTSLYSRTQFWRYLCLICFTSESLLSDKLPINTLVPLFILSYICNLMAQFLFHYVAYTVYRSLPWAQEKDEQSIKDNYSRFVILAHLVNDIRLFMK